VTAIEPNDRKTGSASGFRAWQAGPLAVLALLFIVNLSNNLDRSIMFILAQPIKEEFALADWQLGLMNGFSFSIVFLLLGFPMARLADRGNRTAILSLCVTAWSAMTALCGLTTTFLQLCFCRAGVGIGEAGCLPASHSLISDYFPREARTRALALYGLGLPLGGLAGAALGGWVMDLWGWRAVFVIIGLPGIALALAVRLIVREPPRGRFDPQPVVGVDGRPSSYGDVICLLWRSPVARNVLVAIMGAGLAASPNGIFLGPYLIRRFHIGFTQLGFAIALTFMLGSAISTFGGGQLIHWLTRRDERWAMWIPAIGALLSVPLHIAAYVQATWQGMVAILFVASVVSATYLAPCFATLHGIVGPGGRAKASVIAQFGFSMMAINIGPLVSGLAIDLVARGMFAKFAVGPFATICPGGHAHGATIGWDATCGTVLADATRFVIVGFLVGMIWPALHFLLAARAMKRGER
jgi:predicted MFS family arabinose efflux permease